MDAFAVGAMNFSTTKAGIAVGTTTTLTTANTQLYSIRGKSYTKAGVSNEATPTTDGATAAAFRAVPVSKGSVFTICRNAAGDLKVVQGSIVDLDAANAFIVAPQFGPQIDSLAPIGYILVKVGSSGAAWTFGTSNLAGPPTGVVFTLVDVNTLPDRPQIA